MRATAVVLTLMLAGCSGGGVYQWHHAVGGGAGLPEVTMGPAGEGVVVPPGRGTPLAVALRSFVPATGGGWTEVQGARCMVTGGDMLAVTTVAPVRVILPDLGPDAPVLRADCRTDTAEGAAAVAPAFSWPVEGRPDPIQRSWWGGGWWWGYQKTGPLSYPDLAVGMHPIARQP